MKIDAEIELLVLLYVDDFLISGTPEAKSAFIEVMNSKYKLTFTELVEEHLSVQLQRSENSSCLHQQKLIGEGLAKFGVQELRGFRTPLETSYANEFPTDAATNDKSDKWSEE